MIAPFFDDSHSTPVRGFLHRPDQPTGDGLVLAHGASSNCQAPLLSAVAEVFAEAAWTVLRIDLPYRQLRPHGPPSPATAARDREGIQSAINALRRIATGRLLGGGHSYGGRQASMVAAEQPGLSDGLVLFSYPLHPPGRPDRPRTEHLAALRVPVVFLHGTRDPFGSIEEMRAAIARIPAPVELVVIEGAGHDLGRSHRQVAAMARQAVASAVPT